MRLKDKVCIITGSARESAGHRSQVCQGGGQGGGM
jgi:hypothetical protein